MAVLVDTGILYALADEDDRWHEPAREWLEDQHALLIATVTVLPEVCYLLQTRLGAEAEQLFVESVASGQIELEDLKRPDLARCRELMKKYPQIGFVDASIAAIAERLKIDTIATTDRRHFQTVKPRHIKSFTLVPRADVA